MRAPPGLDECQDSNGVATTSGGHGALNTSTPGPHSYYVLALSKDGENDEVTITYMVGAAPTATITNPTPGGTPTLAHNSTAHLPFSCAEGTGGPGLASCDGYNETGIDTIDTSSGGSGLLDTSNTGTSVYTVVAISNDGARTSTHFTYKVADPPTATIISPTGSPTYLGDERPSTSFSCAEGAGRTGLSDCSDGITSGTTGTIDANTLASECPGATTPSATGCAVGGGVNAGLSPGQTQQIAVTGEGDIENGFTTVTVIVPGGFNVYAYVPQSELVTEGYLGGGYDPTAPGNSMKNEPAGSCDCVTFCDFPGTSGGAADVTKRKGKVAELQTAMLAAHDGELAGWLEVRSVWFRLLASVLRAQHGAKRTAALTKVLDLKLPDALFVKAVHSLTRAEVLSIVDALRAQHKISQATATALSKAAGRRAKAAFVRAARATPVSLRLLLYIVSTSM